MRAELGRLNVYQIRFHVLDDAIAHFAWKKIDDGSVDMRGRSKRPPFDAITFDQLGNVVRQLAQNPAINLILELRALGNRVEVPSAARLTA